MSQELPGAHFCIGTARTVVDLAFRGLRALCIANGGNLSLAELDSYYEKLIDSFLSGVRFFEVKHEQCMDASMSMAKMPFARNRILATLLHACGEKSARNAFPLQINGGGAEWIDELFDGLAQYVRKRVGISVDDRLINAYVFTATKPGTKVTIVELLRQEAVRCVFLECVGTFEKPNAPELIAKEVCGCVNEVIVGRRGWPDVCKITESQARSFLTWLPEELGNALRPVAVLSE